MVSLCHGEESGGMCVGYWGLLENHLIMGWTGLERGDF